MTLDELATLCGEWQERLRLQDWKVVVNFRRAWDMDEDQQACCTYVIRHKSARISILDPIDYEPNKEFPQDVEQSLVHELLHLHFAPFWNPEDGMMDVAQEQAVDLIAWALVNARREAAPVDTKPTLFNA